MPIYKTKYPLNIYLLISCLLIQLFFMRDFSIMQIVFYFSLSFLFLYTLFSRYACKIEIYKESVYIRYFFFWDKNIRILFKDIYDVDFEKGFYDFTTHKSLGNGFAFPKYCYDIISFNGENYNIEANVNTRTFMFSKAYSLIEAMVKDREQYKVKKG